MTKPATDERLARLERAISDQDTHTASADVILSLIARIRQEQEDLKEFELLANRLQDELGDMDGIVRKLQAVEDLASSIRFCTIQECLALFENEADDFRYITALHALLEKKP